MDKRTSISTVILVLLILLTLVSLGVSAYLYFTFNPMNPNTEEQIVEENEYEGWNTYTSENLFLTIKYPSDWILEDHKTTEDQNYDILRVSSLPNENDFYDNYVYISKVKQNDKEQTLSEYLKSQVEESTEEGNMLSIFTCDLENTTQKWGVQTYKCSSSVEWQENTINYFIFRDNIYSISYPIGEGVDSENIEKVLNSIVLYPY